MGPREADGVVWAALLVSEHIGELKVTTPRVALAAGQGVAGSALAASKQERLARYILILLRFSFITGFVHHGTYWFSVQRAFVLAARAQRARAEAEPETVGRTYLDNLYVSPVIPGIVRNVAGLRGDAHKVCGGGGLLGSVTIR